MRVYCKDIYKSFVDSNIDVLNGVCLDIPSGGSLAISGPSGVGKSTLLNIIAGLDDLDSGDIFFDNICFNKLSRSNKTLFRLNNISHIFQQPNLLKDFNVLENILLPLRYRGNSLKESREIALSCLEDMSLLEHQESPISILSGGEAQRVGIARAIAMKSKIILADEPTGNLDSSNSDLVIKSLIEICYSNMITLIIVSHDEKIITKMNNKIRMIDGKVI